MPCLPLSLMTPNIGARELRRCVLSPTGLATRRPEQPCSKSRKTTSAWPSAPNNEQGGCHSQSSDGSRRRMRSARAGMPFRSEPILAPQRGAPSSWEICRGAARRPFFSAPHRAIPGACVPSQGCSLFSHVLANPYYQRYMRIWRIIGKCGNKEQHHVANAGRRWSDLCAIRGQTGVDLPEPAPADESARMRRIPPAMRSED